MAGPKVTGVTVRIPRSSLGKDLARSGYYRAVLRREAMHYLIGKPREKNFMLGVEYLRLRGETVENLEKAGKLGVCDCGLFKGTEPGDPWAHRFVALGQKVGSVGTTEGGVRPPPHTCPAFRPYYELAWCWLWNYPNERSLNRRKLEPADIERARKSLALAFAFRWAYSDKNDQADARDLQSGKWIDRAQVDSMESAIAESKRVWQRFKEQGGVPEFGPEFSWDGAFMGVGLTDSIPELEVR